MTLVPAQIGFSEATMLTLTGNTGFTVTVAMSVAEHPDAESAVAV